MTQGQLAQSAGVAQGSISKLEHGLISADSELVEKLSGVLGYPAEFFWSDIQATDLPAVFYRKKKSLLRAPDEKAIKARVTIMRRGIARLLQSVEIPESRLSHVDLARDGLRPSEIARDLRAQWGIPRGPIDSVTSILERAGVVVVPFDFGVRSIDAMSLYRPEDAVPPMIFFNPECPGDRMRFTLAHELGHILFHHHQPVPAQEKEIECEADEFAGEFVAPGPDIRPYLANVTFDRLAGLKRHWKLSMLCLLKRAQDLGRISDWKAQQMWMAASKMGYRTAEPVPIAPEEPSLLAKVLRVHTEDLGYTEAELFSAMQGDLSALHRKPQLRAVK